MVGATGCDQLIGQDATNSNLAHHSPFATVAPYCEHRCLAAGTGLAKLTSNPRAGHARPTKDHHYVEHYVLSSPDDAVVDDDIVRDGTQTIVRAVTLLRLMTRRGGIGWRLNELTRVSGLTHPTCRRILKCLTDQGMVARDADSTRYRLGPLTYELGLATGIRLEFRERLRPAMERVAAATGDTVYLCVRSGFDTVCIDRIEGSFPIRAITMEIGGRRPLGFGSAGLALLATLDDEEVSHIVQQFDHEFLINPRMTREGLLKSVAATRAQGYGVIRDTTVLGVGAIGVTLPQRPDRPMLGVAVAMLTNRLPQTRVKTLYKLLVDEFKDL